MLCTDDPALNTVKGLLRAQKFKPGVQVGVDQTGGAAQADGGNARRRGPGSMSVDQLGISELGRRLESRAEVSTISESTSKRSEKVAHTSSQGKWLNPRNIKSERKFQIFGDLQALPETEDNPRPIFFIAIIRNICREILGGLLSAAETFYKQKGFRAVTRPGDIPASFDECADQILDKLLSYYNQVEVYHNDSLIGELLFRKLLSRKS